MVEILKRGKPSSKKTITTTCEDCHTKFRFAVSESRYVNDQRDGDAYVIKCPVCKKENWIAA